ncbi:MAG TPA: GPW/gp25 family protein [Flavipsychrobacter sp.]|nr:GPW/gp25 family protein [Flavipsychrobacter sp.]
MNINYPYKIDHNGRTSLARDEKHIIDMIEQVLFTSPGERVNRPTFGSGLMQLVFQPNSDELATTTQFLVQGALQQWLGELIEVNDVQVQNLNSTLYVKVDFVIRSTQEQKQAEFKKIV